MNKNDGNAGISCAYARADHTHPIDTNLLLNEIGAIVGNGNAITSLTIN
jgi:hypothetical protein